MECWNVADIGDVSLNPVRAKLVRRAEDWRWSSAAAHLAGEDDAVVEVAPALDRIGDFSAFLGESFDEAFTYSALRKAESVGRPVGSKEWLGEMEAKTGMDLLVKNEGRRGRCGREVQRHADSVLMDMAHKILRSDGSRVTKMKNIFHARFSILRAKKCLASPRVAALQQLPECAQPNHNSDEPSG